MILLLGANGYIGHAFANCLRRRKGAFIPLSHDALDYSRFELLFDYVRKLQPELVINAEDEARIDVSVEGVHELQRMQMLRLNVLLPQTVARVCEMTHTPWAHLSSGTIYSGSKILADGTLRAQELLSSSARELYRLHPERFAGFTELDEPNFTFRSQDCTFYSGTKALAEEAIQHCPHRYTWRLNFPFNEQDDPRNFISQVREGTICRDSLFSLSHLDDCAAACLDLWECRAPYGIYNVVNPGAIQAHQILEKLQRTLKLSASLRLFLYEDDPKSPHRSPQSCILDASKIRSTGIKLRNVHDALDKALERWQSSEASMKKTFA